MKTTAAVLALVGAVVANPFPQAVTSSIAPKASAPAGCETTYSSTFEISVVNVTSTTTKRSTALMCTLTNGTLTDAEGRTGYIASNYQFQFDKPAQAGAIYTSGWSVCANETLALGGSAVFFQCLSGTFYNLYDESTGNQCNEVYIDVIPIGSSSATAVATESADGQVTASAVATQLTDGQIQATTGVVTQITDGQIQATTGVVTQISDGQIQATTGVAVVTQISDGQIQATTAAVVSQISDGQIQATKATTAAVVSQISDGQIQATKATTAAVVSQISDGQIQATTAAPVTQISDGQIQVATSTKGVVSQISDGQIQASASNGTLALAAVTASSTPLQQTANAAATAGPFFGLAAGVLAAALL